MAAIRSSSGTSKAKGDREGFVTAPRQQSVEELTEDPDFLFRDHTDWSVMDTAAQAPYRYNERDLHRAYADNCYATREFLMANYVRFTRIQGTHGNGGMSRARRATTFLMEGPTTDIKKGTITKQDAGVAGRSSSHFAPRLMTDGAKIASPGARINGAALSRGLEFSAREKGVRFLLNRHMDEIIREQQFSGRVVGIRASYSPRFDPQTGARLESLWQNGNVDDRTETIFIRARKAIVIGAGGHGANPQFRSMFYPAWREPAFVSSGWALLGPARPGRQRHHRRHADRGQPRGDAAEPRVRQHVPFSGRAGHARSLHRHASGPPDVPVPGIDRASSSAAIPSST